MARRGGGGSTGGPMGVLISAFIGVLVIVAILVMGPVMGGKLEVMQASNTGGSCSFTNTTSGTTTVGVCGQTVSGDTSYTYNVAYAGAGLWNSTTNTNLPKGSTVWTDSISIGVIAILIFFISLAIYYIRSIG